MLPGVRFRAAAGAPSSGLRMRRPRCRRTRSPIVLRVSECRGSAPLRGCPVPGCRTLRRSLSVAPARRGVPRRPHERHAAAAFLRVRIRSAARSPPKPGRAHNRGARSRAPLEAKLRRRVADQGDASVAELDEVASCHLAAGHVVDRDAWEGRMHRVDEDAGDARGAKAIHLGLGRERRDDEQAVGPVASIEQLECPALPWVLRLDVEHHQVIRRATEAFDDASYPLHRGRVREPGQKRCHHHRPPEGEAAGEASSAGSATPRSPRRPARGCSAAHPRGR